MLIYSHKEDASVGDVTDDGRLVSISHSEHGDNRHPALRVVTPDGTAVADLWDGPGKGLDSLGFAPGPRAAARRSRAARPLRAADLGPRGRRRDARSSSSTSTSPASWTRPGSSKATPCCSNAASARARSCSAPSSAGLDGRSGSRSPRPSHRSRPRPAWSPRPARGPAPTSGSPGRQERNPPRVRDLADHVVVRAPGPPPPPGAPFRDVIVETAGGSVACAARGAARPGPAPRGLRHPRRAQRPRRGRLRRPLVGLRRRRLCGRAGELPRLHRIRQRLARRERGRRRLHRAGRRGSGARRRSSPTAPSTRSAPR